MAKARKAAAVKAAIIAPYAATLLENISEGKRVINFPKGKRIFSQGEPADAIYFVESGRVKVSVLSPGGKEAILKMLGPRHFFGEGALLGQSLRVSTATTVEAATLFLVERRAMLRALHAQPDLSERFMASLLKRNLDLEEDLCDQLFNDREKRLARVLLKLARLRERDFVADASVPKLSHETLAEMVGTTRSSVARFMNKFRKLGLIEYNGELVVRVELLTDLVLHD
jgi:CRP/FNR family cyclic AMP-dependent transcriptional regulator